MSLTDINIKQEYRSLSDDIINDFYIPLLSEATLYQRAVGFFSSSALIELTKGICGLIKNGGKIRLIASPRLSEEDIEAINNGLKKRETVIEEALLRTLESHLGDFQEERLNLLSNLIAYEKLEIKIAFLESLNEYAMYHEKMGLITDIDNNTVAFSGSMNESLNAFRLNYESIDVFTSWLESSRVKKKMNTFEAMWKNSEKGIQVIDFPEVNKAILDKYKKNDDIDLNLDTKEFIKNSLHKPHNEETEVFTKQGFEEEGADSQSQSEEIRKSTNNIEVTDLNEPHIPSTVEIRDYQNQAIENWVKNNYRGIYDMATGTGKTYTALASIVRLYNDLNGKIAVIIVCPYQHLVEQWKEDVLLFGFNPLVCYSASSTKNWKNSLENRVKRFNKGSRKHFCVITTNATFLTSFMQEQLAKLDGNLLIVADEAHNLGASKIREKLPLNFPYRLALSATINRHSDEEGTNAIFDYFGDKCIEYTLEQAIKANMLTPYYYHPILVYLDNEELDAYITLTEKISKALSINEKGKNILSEYAKMLLIQRARLVAGTKQKLFKLEEIIKDKYINDRQLLVYCGATTINDIDYDENNPDTTELRQIDAVLNILGNKLNMRVRKFTSEENIEERANIKSNFSNDGILQCLVAIRCLDEGVNIPGIKTAFILASSTNPKEYIQRRGRVLRKADNKKFAEIYDFITLPFPIDDNSYIDSSILSNTRGLAKREIIRMKDFASIALNPSDSDFLIFEIQEKFNITILSEENDSYV